MTACLPGVVDDCPEHVIGCELGQYISRERWGMVRHRWHGGGAWRNTSALLHAWDMHTFCLASPMGPATQALS